jgi:hypothetical protein
MSAEVGSKKSDVRILFPTSDFLSHTSDLRPRSLLTPTKPIITIGIQHQAE